MPLFCENDLYIRRFSAYNDNMSIDIIIEVKGIHN